MKIVVTGYRAWRTADTVFRVLSHWVRDYERTHQALNWVPPPVTVATGACPTGADAFAAAWCRAHGVTLLEFPADWSQGKGAGPERNRTMINTVGPDLVLAFMHPLSRGTRQCMEYARSKGIEVREYWEGR